METICKYNIGVFCPEENCERCGWNPPVFEQRKKLISEQYKVSENTKIKTVLGRSLNLKNMDYTPTYIKFQISETKYGFTLSLSDEIKGVMLQIPLDSIEDLIEVKDEQTESA